MSWKDHTGVSPERLQQFLNETRAELERYKRYWLEQVQANTKLERRVFELEGVMALPTHDQARHLDQALAALRELVEADTQYDEAVARGNLGDTKRKRDEALDCARSRIDSPESAEATAERWEAEEAGLPVVIPTEESK